MIRVTYKWKVKEEDVAEFKAAWAATTTAIRAGTPGARGSFMLQSHQDPTLFITIARWDKLEDWQAFWDAAHPPQMETMHALAERLSVESFEEIDDHTI
ncbi:MAG: antibiotic biosynthesis monooxygenase [Anaerolineae bacterium]|nr:antibiotic biosynthesis monooxygenase [Anaerolineae bacterium]